MTNPVTGVPDFAVVPGAAVAGVLHGAEKPVQDVIEEVYRTHGAGDTVLPPSYFLRFPDRPTSRIIALPASLGRAGSAARVDGMKWISSFPENVAAGIPRASAVLVLNDPVTGYPFACMESSIISAVRTAGSAALAAEHLSRSRGVRPRRVGYIGTGLIARYVHQHLVGTGWEFDEVGVHDLSAEHAGGFRDYLRRTDDSTAVTVHRRAEDLVRGADLVVFATVAAAPHVTEPGWFEHNPLVLHVSLRDLAPEVITASANVVDDIDHCLRAATSVHLAEQQTGGRGFVDGTLYDVLTGGLTLPADRPVVFSPFGLGVLDLGVGLYVYDRLRERGELRVVDGFFHELSRYGDAGPARG